MVQKIPYEAGFWIGTSISSFIDGFMDAVEPTIKTRLDKIVKDVTPNWLERLFT